jgi:hypothetical protein
MNRMMVLIGLPLPWPVNAFLTWCLQTPPPGQRRRFLRSYTNTHQASTMAKSLRSKIKRRFRTELRKKIGVPHEAKREEAIQENLRKAIESQSTY